MCWACLVFFAAILGLLTLQADTRQALVVTPAWFALLAIAYQFVRRQASRQPAATSAEPTAALPGAVAKPR
jgi:D-serine/D-alanine/glycine transporter